MLHSISPQNRFVVYRTVLSERQEPDGFRLNEEGELTQDGRFVLDYVGVVEVEVWLPMDEVEVYVEDKQVLVSLPAPQLEPIINYRMSFSWRESRSLPGRFIPVVMEHVRKLAARHATEHGAVEEAQEAAKRWFEAFLTPLAGSRKVIVRQADVPLQALK